MKNIKIAGVAIGVLLAAVFLLSRTPDGQKGGEPGSQKPGETVATVKEKRGQQKKPARNTAAERPEQGSPGDAAADAPKVEPEPEMTEEEKREAEEEKLVDEFDKTVDKFRDMFRRVPKARKDECIHRALNLVPDENVMLLAGILFDKEQDKEILDLVFNDILNRDEDVKKPILKELFKDREHPNWADTAWILDVTGEMPKQEK